MKKLLVFAMILVSGISAHAQFTMQIVADNDFAILSGTSTSVDNLLYQNDVPWPDQLSDLSSLSFNLPSGDTTFYVLGLGGGGQENISGTINGIDITSISPVNVSSDLGPYLTGYEGENTPGGTVEAGTFNVSLADVQTAFPNLTFSDASSDINYSDNVIQYSPNGVGYDFPSSTAVLYQFSASLVGVSAAPEPNSLALLGIGLAALVVMLWRRKSPSISSLA